mgnify:CR=1 FL=1
MALTKVLTGGIADDAIGNTKLALDADYAFTGTISGAGLASPFPTGTAVTSEGGAVTTNIAQGLAKVWCNINVSSVVQDSLNISSVTDHGSGENTYNFTNAFSALTYVALGHNSDDATANRGTNVQGTWTGGNQATSKVRMNTFSSADCSYYGTTSHGDLA